MAIPTDLSALKAEINKPKVEEETTETTEEVNIRNTAYSTEAFEKAWKEFIGSDKLQTLERELLSGYTLENHTITVAIPNEALTLGFERFRSDLLMHMRNALKNDHIMLKSQIVEIEKGQMLYTDREKFSYLKEKYPALKDLQEKLGLDPEF